MVIIFKMKTKLLVLFCVSIVQGYGRHHHPQTLINPTQFKSRALPHYNPVPTPPKTPRYHYDAIITSPSNNQRVFLPPPPPPPQYRTLNPPPQQYRAPRSEKVLTHPHLIASASSTPVLVLKKDVQRPILTQALAPSPPSSPQQQQAQQQPQTTPKIIPTVIIESPKKQQQQQPDPLLQSQSQHSPTSTPKTHHHVPTTQPKQYGPPQQTSHEQDETESLEQQQPRHHHVHNQQPNPQTSSSSQEPPETPPSASAERRMFFESVSQNNGFAQQVSGPQGPSNPTRSLDNKQKQIIAARAAAAAAAESRQQPSPRHHHAPAAPTRPHHHHHHRHEIEDRDDEFEEEEDEQIERITRSNSNAQYGVGGFAYPPQSNYIGHGPTRVPVKYQQGVVGLKPQHHHHHHGQQHQHRQHPHQQQHPHPPPPYKQRVQQQQPGLTEELTSEELEEAEEAATPDRLTELLATSKFTCAGKKDGYYADDSLNCEVFHYCQDGGKHSWLCPNGFAFHQIHLICVPPSSDNICKQSSNYHFVNEYLYKPINEREAEVTNASLKYADRYFPDGYNHGAGDVLLPYNDDEETGSHHGQRHHHHPHHASPQQQQQQPKYPQQPRPTQHHAQIPAHIAQQLQQHYTQKPRPSQPPPYNPYAQQQPRPTQQGFVPIPGGLNQRPHHQPYAQQRSSHSQYGYGSNPTQQPPHHHHKSSSKQLKPYNPQSSSSPVFFSPESINIPLNQRRPIPNPHPSHHPQIFRASPQVVSKQLGSGSKSSSSSGSLDLRKYQQVDYEEY